MDLKYEPFVGRTYEPGRVHCLSLVRDFFMENFGISIGNYPIPDDWHADKIDMIGMISEREKADKVENWSIKTLQPADVLCVAIRSSNPNHLVIHVGNGLLLHHPYGHFSRVEQIRDFWRMNTCYVLRHPDVPKIAPTLPETSVLELARAQYHPQAEA